MNHYLKYFLVMIILSGASVTSAQLGDPIYLQTFGEGTVDPTVVGKNISPAKSDFTYSDQVCPPAGSYSIVKQVEADGCSNGMWYPLPFDDNHTNNGMFMLVNNTSSAGNRIIYSDTTEQKKLCAGTTYSFLVAIINVSNPAITCQSPPSFPVFEFRIEDDKGNIIAKDTTKGIKYANPAVGDFYNDYGLRFIMPANVSRLVIKITLLHEGYTCGEDFAIDNIRVSPYGPNAQINFTNDNSSIVKSVCYADNKTISLTGSMDPYYQNPVLQWQQSIDSGKTWTDIPGATGNMYAATFSTPDTFLLRLTGADAPKIDNPNCRVASNNLKVEVDGPPKNFTIKNNSPVCAGQDLQFDGEGGASYVWNGPNNFYDNVQAPHIPNVSLKDSGTYYVQVTSLGGCTATATTHVIINGIDVIAGPDTSICYGSSVMLHASAGSGYAWSPADSVSNAAIQNPKVNPTTTTTYIVNVTSADGCSDTAKAAIQVIGSVPVKAGFSSNQYLCKPSDTLTFSNTSTGDISSWQWNFDNGQTSIDKNPPTVYYFLSDNTSSYTVSLKVADSLGCKDSAFHILKVEGNCYIAVPTAFTPNGDGLNDYLYPLNAYKATDLTFRVYNRFGELIFLTKDWTKKWDGTKNSLPQPTGTYIWMLEYTDAGNKKISLRGTTVLLR